MKPKDVIKQLIGEDTTYWDEQGPLQFQFYGTFKTPDGQEASIAYVSFEEGIVQFFFRPEETEEDTDVVDEIVGTYAIKATLEKIENT